MPENLGTVVPQANDGELYANLRHCFGLGGKNVDIAILPPSLKESVGKNCIVAFRSQETADTVFALVSNVRFLETGIKGIYRIFIVSFPQLEIKRILEDVGVRFIE